MQKYLVLVAILVLVAVAGGESVDSGNSNNLVNHRQGKTFEGALTSGFTTALSSLGTIGILGLILIGILLLPTILSLIFGNALGRTNARNIVDSFKVDKQTIIERLVMLQDVWEKFDVRDAQCRQRLICEVHTVETQLGTTARSIIKFIDYASQVNTFYLPEFLRNVIKEYVDAANSGKNTKSCSQFEGCPYSFTDQVLNGKSSKKQ